MKGRFLKAPLVYVVAQIRLNFLELTQDQKTQLGQSLMATIYRNKLVAIREIKHINISDGKLDNVEFTRDAYLSHDKTDALIFNYLDKVIQFRTSNYTNSAEFLSKIFDALNKVISSVPALGNLPVAEVSFNYVDLIVPTGERKLYEYFKNGKQVLPLATIEEHHHDDFFQSGVMKFTRILKDQGTKLDVEVSHLPQSTKKLIPDALIEHENDFAMPLNVKQQFSGTPRAEYAMVWTVASKAAQNDSSLGGQELQQYCYSSHSLAKEMFESLINRDVCEKDWDWVTTEVN
jgi:uncharacterized protein (TIGR04255 family)